MNNLNYYIYDDGSIVLYVNAGELFKDIARKAQLLAKNYEQTVHFDINDRRCFVDSTTNLENLHDHYLKTFALPGDEEHEEDLQVGPNL